MIHFALLLIILVISRPFDGTRADWADEQQKHQAKAEPSSATNSDTTEDILHQSKYPVPLSSDFTGIRRSRAFVDKTFFLHEWLTHRPKFWYVTAPPGFGKSTLAAMAVQFLNASFEIVNGTAKFHEKHKTPAYELFQGTNIYEMRDFFDEHFQNYVVVYIDLGPLSSTTEAVFSQTDDFNTQDFHLNFRMVIKKMMSHYPSLLHHENLNETERATFKDYLKDGMDPNPKPGKFWQSASLLMKLLNKCLKKKIVVIVDSYDALCKPAMIGDLSSIRRPYFASYIINFSKNIIKDGLSTVLYLGSFNTLELMLKKAIEENSENQLTRQIQHTDFFREERIAKYFGLSAQEVLEVLKKYSLQDDFQLLDHMLNGHAVLESPLTLFNTRSVFLYVANRNATPRALISPMTAEILHNFENMFARQTVSHIVTESIFADKSEVLMKYQKPLHFTRFTKFKRLVTNTTGIDVEESFKVEISLSFIKILQYLGLLSAVHENLIPDRYFCNLRASSHCDAEFMLECLYNSGSIEKFFKISADDELAMIRAVKGLAPTNDSIQTLGETIHNIVKARVPEADFQLKSLMYVYARKVATHYSEDFTLEAMIAAPKTEHSKSNKDLRNDTKERIDIILVLKSKKIGVIMTSKFNTSATTLLEEMTNRKYVDVFESDSRFSKLGIANKILIGISVQSDGSVQIAAEAWHQDEKTNLKNVVINNTSLQ
ncbi:unnamed protein product [Bemisia tabaci]|uniref:AAA-ATPase-like domain-containing protein n=1 Tax=Bemisia tabaci TaxID=7038 RepID=A0A9P0CA89_BEMTA|nr:unnamed protein product [Bemisia tabaci]